MPHLSPERLAALVDEPATADEQTHLAQCATCLGELGAMRRLVSLAAMERDRLAPPLTTWESVSGAVQRSGIMAGAEPTAPQPAIKPRAVWLAPMMRAAAAVLLVLGGLVGGRWSAGARLWPLTGGRGVEVAAVSDSVSFQSADEATRAIEQAEKTYKAAAAYVAAHDTTGAFNGKDEAQVRTRLAALDDMMATTRAALYAAPQDPVINQYYLATLGAREATLRQLGGAQPVSMRVAY